MRFCSPPPCLALAREVSGRGSSQKIPSSLAAAPPRPLAARLFFKDEFVRREAGVALHKRRRVSLTGSPDFMQALTAVHEIYCLLGTRGRKWMDAAPHMQERRTSIFLTPIGRRFDARQLQTQLAFMARWEKWCSINLGEEDSRLSPSAFHSAAFLEDLSHRGPTVAFNLFGAIYW